MKNEKMIIRPSYYDQFSCLAGACEFTCCRDWEITVDRLTEKRWESTPVPDTMLTNKTCLHEYVHPIMGGSAITLEPNGRCPFLNENGLCHIVKQYGEEAISHTCHVYPRERHIFAERIEDSLNLGCPEALRLLWDSPEFTTVSKVESVQRRIEDAEGNELLFQLRDRMVEFLKRKEIPLDIAWKMLFYLLLGLENEELQLTAEGLKEALETGFLTQLRAAVEQAQPDPVDRVNEQNELFLDLAENYRKKKIYAWMLEEPAGRAEDYEEEGERLLKRREAFQPVWDSLEDRIRVLMQEEVYASLYLPTGNLYTMTMKMEWMGIFYAALQQMLFLEWDLHGELTEQRFMQIVMILVRMTGYNEDDIEEYLENSFEDVIWDWGYMALII